MLAALVATGCRPGGPADTGPRKIEVLFLGHASRHHDSEAYAPILASALALDGINVSYTNDPDDLNPENLARYDALILYANHDSITGGQEKALMDFVASGKGFIPLHSASYCFRNSDDFVDLVGAQFASHETGTFTTEIIDATHPITAGFAPFETWDETYVHTRHNPDRTVLMERVEGDHREPWTWTRTHGKGRVFYTAYGHDERTWNNPGFQDLVKRGILWAVGDDLRARWEQLSFQPFRYVPHDSIPNYEKRDPPLELQEPFAPESSMAYIQVPPDFELQLFASEPDIAKPIAMAWDERGRLWVIETTDYPNTVNPDHIGSDKIKIVEDTDGDGKADRFTVFADSLNIPTSITFADGGVIISMAPNFLFLKDTDGDDRADVREVISSGWGTYDTHAGPSNLRYGFDNWYWGTVGYSDFSGVVDGDSVELIQGVYRFPRDGSALEQVAKFTNNTWGLGFSETFDIFGSTANNEHSVYVAIPERYYAGVSGLRGNGRQKIDGHYAFHPNTPNFRQVDVFGGFTAAAGHNLYTARSFPQRYWNRIALVNEPTGGLTHEAILEPSGAGFKEKDGWNLLASVDEWVSPIHAEVGPDGAVWVLDWYNFIVQHNPTPQGFTNGRGNAYVNALRDKVHGRIYRVAYKKAPRYTPRSLSKDDPNGLVDALGDDNLFWRMTAQRLLVERGETDVLNGLYAHVRNRKVDAIGLNGAAVNALWTMHGLGALDGSNDEALGVAREALRHPAAGVRKAAAQVLPATEATLDGILESGLVNDPDPHTRLAVILKLSELPASDAAGAALYAAGKEPGFAEDTWLPEALFIAAARHTSGYLDAYSADIGGAAFTRLAAGYARGEDDPAPDWSPVGFDDAAWKTVDLPAKWDDLPEFAAFDGVIWYRRAIDVPAGQAGRAARIDLGAIYDTDVVYVNGQRVGGMVDGFDTARSYPIPAGVLKGGSNLIAVRVEDPRGRGGFWGVADDMYLTAGGQRLSLAGAWRYAVEEEYVGGKRQDLKRNIPLAQQFLKHHAADVAGTPAASAGTATTAVAGDVAQVALSVVVGQLKYDQTTFTVKPGQRVRIVFTNPDDMQHNLLILDQGATEAVGALADAMVTAPDAASRNYVPDSPAVLASTPLVDPRGSFTLEFTAPAAPGNYPYLCTFPGHWRIMQGVMVVR
ncbi:MAG: ThuA domain-containing protein [Rhodothermales bacterium]